MPNEQSTSLITRKTLFIILSVSAALSIAGIGFRADTLNLENAILGILIAWCGFIPGFLYLIEPSETRSPLPFAPLIGLFYALFFGISVFLVTYLRDTSTGFIVEYGSILIENISVEAQVLVLTGTVLMFLTWSFANKKVFKSTPHFKISGAHHKSKIFLAAWCLALISIAYYLVPEIQGLPSVGQFIKPSGIVAFSIFSYFLTHGTLPKTHAIPYFLIAFPAWMFGLLSTGSSTVIILVAGLLLINFINAKNRVPWGPIICLPLFIIALYAFLNTYRHFIWIADPGAGHFQNLKHIGNALSRLDGYNLPEIKQRALGLPRRITSVLILNRVVQMSPEPVPFLNGKTYRPFFSSWIPRIFWKDKPIENAGEAFGHRYNWIISHLKNQSMNIPWIVEMYANFGRYGVLFGMVCVGIFLSFLDRFFNRASMNPLDISVGSAVIIPLTFPDSNFSLMTGTLLPLTICLWIYFTVGLRIPLPGSAENSKTSDKAL